MRKSSGILFEIYAFSGQNSQFGKLTEKLSPPSFFKELLNLCCEVLKKPCLKSLGAIFENFILRCVKIIVNIFDKKEKKN
jgi:hypothetical protein